MILWQRNARPGQCRLQRRDVRHVPLAGRPLSNYLCPPPLRVGKRVGHGSVRLSEKGVHTLPHDLAHHTQLRVQQLGGHGVAGGTHESHRWVSGGRGREEGGGGDGIRVR